MTGQGGTDTGRAPAGNGRSGRETARLGPAAWVPVGLAVAAAAVAAVAAAGVLPSGGGASSRGPTATARQAQPTATAAPTARVGTSSPSPAALTAARILDDLLVLDAQNRALVQSATDQIASCQDLVGAVAALRERAAFRGTLLGALARVDLGALPGAPALTTALRDAWQYSMSSDEAYAQWGIDEGRGCTPDDTADAGYQAARQSDTRASAAKQSFVSEWNRAARSYGLPAWRADHI